jgi:hypothetical protein
MSRFIIRYIMGAKQSAIGRTSIRPSEKEYNAINEIFTFNIEKLKSHLDHDKHLNEKKFTGKFIYAFDVQDYFELSKLLFNLDYARKFNNKFAIQYSVKTSDRNIYSFNINISFTECLLSDLFLCIFILVDIVPNKYFSKVVNFREIINEMKEIAKSNDPDNALQNQILQQLQFINLNGDIFLNINDPDIKAKYAKRAKQDCVICIECPKSVIFLPCKHFSCCERCSNLEYCPICRTEIANKIIVFDC